MEITVNEQPDKVMITVVGDIEMMTIKELKTKLMDAGNSTDKDIELDLSGVDYIDSSGVGVLISLVKLQKKKGKEINISAISDKVLNVLKLSSLADIFNLE